MIKLRKIAAAVDTHAGRNSHNCCTKSFPSKLDKMNLEK